MLKKIITTSLVVSTLILSGCGDTEGESRLETQNMLDKGDFNGVIAKLEGSSSSNEDYMALASAYMGKAGYSILEIASAMSKDDTEDNEDPMGKLIGEGKPASSINDLSKAATYYKKVVGEKACDTKEDNNTLSTNQKDVCLFIGLSAVAKTATTLNLLADNMSSFSTDDKEDDSNTTDYKLDATGCAMQFAFDYNLSQTITSTQDCNITIANEDVNFTLVNRVYRPFDVHVNKDTNQSNLYHFMMTQEDNVTHTRSTVLTKDYCTAESFERFKEYNETLYACPINEDPEIKETTSVGVLTDTINGDLDAILAIAPKNDNDEDEEIGEDEINEFKCEVINGTFDDTTKTCSLDDNTEIDFTTRDITEAELIEYMNTRNKD